MGWMMGPWLISGALMLGATAFLYDGTPDFPARTDLGHGRAAPRLGARHRADGDPSADARGR